MDSDTITHGAGNTPTVNMLGFRLVDKFFMSDSENGNTEKKNETRDVWEKEYVCRLNARSLRDYGAHKHTQL